MNNQSIKLENNIMNVLKPDGKITENLNTENEYSQYKEAITITFGDVAENHKGMQKIGKISNNGFTYEELLNVKKWCDDKNIVTEIIRLHDSLPEDIKDLPNLKAYLLIIRNGVSNFLENNEGSDLLFIEQSGLIRDKKAFMYGRVVNKHARHNLCFGEMDQEPEYENGKGRVYAFDSLPFLKQLRTILPDIIGVNGSNLQAEANYYYDITKCGIGFHGDSERKKVIGIRLGHSIPLHYLWFINNKPVSLPIIISNLKHGDIYIMSEKTTGYDWKKSSIYTLRHSAGSFKFTSF